MNLSTGEICAVLGVRKKVPDIAVSGVVTDSRQNVKGRVFFAIKGDRNNGHDYAADVLKRGAVLCVCSEKVNVKNGVIYVKDTVKALLKVALYYAAKFNGVKTAAVTGSNGKTTVKEMLSAMLEKKFGKGRVLKSEKSFNNHIGVPLTAFGLTGGIKAAVFEVGMNHKGEIKNLVSGLNLDAVIITNTGRAHIGNLGSEKAIALAKAEIFAGLKKGGTAVLNAHSPFYGLLLERAGKKGAEIKSFGTLRNSLQISSYKDTRNGSEFMLKTGGKEQRFKLKLPGLHNAFNAAAAAGCAVSFGVSLKACALAMEKFGMGGLMRFERKKKGRVELINDCYNANPDSFAASLGALSGMKRNGLLIVTGDMLELGDKAVKEHYELGKKLAGINAAGAICYGNFSQDVKRGFNDAGGRYTLAAVSDREELKRLFAEKIKAAKAVFLKGSRGNRLEELEALIK